jgi:hypothetical protein
MAEVESASLVLNTPADAFDCEGRGTTPPAQGGRSVAGVEHIRGGCLSSCGASRRHGDLAREASSVIRARTRARGSMAGRRTEGSSRGHSDRGSSMNRIACGYALKSGGFAACFARWPTCARRSEGLRWRRAAHGRSSSWRGPLTFEEHAAVLAFLTDGESWSSSALALAVGASQRTVQRALDSLAAAGKVQSFGRGRPRRWITSPVPVPGFTTTLLLPAPLPID